MVNLKKKTKQKRSNNRVSSIIETSKDILDFEGIKNFNTNYIAKKCNISIGSLYQYFQSKELIMSEILNREYTNQLKKMENMFSEVKSLKFENKLKAVIETSLNANKLNEYIQKSEAFFDMSKFKNKKINFEEEFLEKSKKFLLDSSQKISPEKIEQALLVIFNSVKNATGDEEKLKEALYKLGTSFLVPQMN